MAEPLKVTISDDVETVRIDPDTGTIEELQPDGGVVVKLDARKPKATEPEENDWFRNLADEIDSSLLSSVAEELHSSIQADDQSRQDWLETRARGMDLIGIKIENPSSDAEDQVNGMSKVTNPLLLEAVVKGWANASAELLPASGPVKVKDDGDETSAEDDLSERLEKDMNHYLTTTERGYYPETSHMLLWGTYFGGSGFKKVYRCPMRKRPVSESVDPKDLIVSNAAKDFASCARITHEIEMRQSVMKRMQLMGAYRDVALQPPVQHDSNPVNERIAAIQGIAKSTRPEDQPFKLWESQCELDIPEFAEGKFKGAGVPLPYLVTMDKDTHQILAIRRDWDEDDEDAQRQRMYVKFPYIPGPGFYGTGMLNLLGNASAALTAAWRECLDAGMLANFPGGLIAKLTGRQNTSNFRMAPGEFAPVETNGQPIGQVVMGSPYRDVTPGIMTLIDKITEQAKSLGTAAEMPSGEGLKDVPVGTMLAQIEQATKIMAAAHKGMHTAASEELELLIKLFRENPEDFWRGNKVCPKGFWNAEKLLQAFADCNLIPVSDPNVPSHIHRVAKALGLVQLFGIPQFAPMLDAEEALKRVLNAMREDPVGLMKPAPPAPPPDPEAQAKMVTAQANMIKANAAVGKVQQESGVNSAKAQMQAQELASQKEIKTADITKELIIHAADQQKIASADRREEMELRQTQLETQHKMELERQRTGADMVKAAAEADARQQELQMKHRTELAKQGLASLTADREHGLAMRTHALDADKAAHDAAVNVHQVMNPPPVAAKPKPKGKK